MRSTLLLAIAITLLAPLPALAQRLPRTVVPDHYEIAFTIDLNRERFSGQETIRVRIEDDTAQIVLHSLELDVKDVTITTSAATQKASVAISIPDQTITLKVPRTLARGAADIHLSFAGALNTRLRGLYLSKTAKRKYAVTQFESTDARRAFPCFDEPSLKATFDVRATIDRGDHAISNGAVVSDQPGPGRTQHTVTFATSPKMSSYLVALTVGDFECVGASEDGIPVRVCATPDKLPLAALALESARAILKFYDGYYDIKYPFRKLDLVAVPDFAAGAMENTAAIFFREADLLADANTASVGAQQNVASTIAHEMAHQWFGDLVTMAWWDDLWLNEGFATWMSTHPIEAWKPEWRADVDAASENQRALSLDSLSSTHPIHATVETPAEIEGAFDTITYQKGAAVLRMIERYVGPETFRRAINAYVDAHKYGNATSEDFWTAVTAAAGRPVDRIMPTFIHQPGVPLVGVALTCTDDARMRVTFSQERFTLDAPPSTAPAPPPAKERWQIPICVKRPGSEAPVCEVLNDVTGTFAIGQPPCAPWVFANAGAYGYYRTAYPRDMLRAMAPDLLTALTAPERLSLVEDEWALVRAGRQAVPDYLTIAAGLGREPTSGVLGVVTSHLSIIHDYLTTGAAQTAFEAFTRSLLGPSFASLGLAPTPGEDDDRRALRAFVIRALSRVGRDADLMQAARTAVDRALAGGEPLDPTAANALVAAAAAGGDAKLYDALAAAADKTSAPEEHYRYLNALTAFRDPALIERALNETKSRVRSQDTALYLSRFFDNPAARERAWMFVKDSWAELEPRIKIAFGEGRLVTAAGQFCDPQARDDVRAFFTAHPLPTATRALNESLERIGRCITLKDTQVPLVAEWLRSR